MPCSRQSNATGTPHSTWRKTAVICASVNLVVIIQTLLRYLAEKILLMTSINVGDDYLLPQLQDQIPTDEQIGTMTGDGAFDAIHCHSAILGRCGKALIPIRKNGRRWREDCPAAKARNKLFKATQRLGRAV